MIWTFKQIFCRKGHTLHMISGISHRCTKAAWTLKGVQRADVMISVKVKKFQNVLCIWLFPNVSNHYRWVFLFYSQFTLMSLKEMVFGQTLTPLLLVELWNYISNYLCNKLFNLYNGHFNDWFEQINILSRKGRK